MCVENPCVPEEPSGPENSQGFVGEEKDVNTHSLVILEVEVCVLGIGDRRQTVYVSDGT